MNQSRDMGDGIVVRFATEADIEEVVALNGRMFCHTDEDEPSEGIMKWTRSLMDGKHPTTSARHFTVAEDTRAGKIVSASGYIPQRWRFGCADLGEPVVEFPVGRPEIVETHRDYRRRGLVRAQFELLHRAGAERGEMVQFIDGIHAYYRQFGYEYAIEKYPLRRGHFGPEQPDKKKKEAPSFFRVRAGTPDDAEFVHRLFRQTMNRSLVSGIHDEAMFRHYIGETGRAQHSALAVVESLDGSPAGMIVYRAGESIEISLWEMEQGRSWLQSYRAVLRWLKQQHPDSRAVVTSLQPDHPLYDVAHDFLSEHVPSVHPAWYVRVPDVPAFLRVISPILEYRLAESPACGHTGELKISFYRDGLRMAFDHGRITAIESWKPTVEDRGNCGFVGLTFLQTLFGYHTLAELHHLHPDCDAWEHEARVLIDTLFPKRASGLWPVG